LRGGIYKKHSTIGRRLRNQKPEEQVVSSKLYQAILQAKNTQDPCTVQDGSGVSVGLLPSRHEESVMPQSPSKKGATPNHLINCESLQPVLDCEQVEFVEFLELMRTPRGPCAAEPVVHPARLLERLCRLRHKRDELQAKYQLLEAVLEKREEKIAHYPFRSLIEMNTRHNANTRAALADKVLDDKKASGKDKTKGKSHKNQRSSKASGATPATWTPLRLPERDTTASMLCGQSMPIMTQGVNARSVTGISFPGDTLIDIAKETLEAVQITLPLALEPTVGVRITYEQDWCSQGYTRGRLVRSIPLTAGGTQKIAIKSWSTRKERREQNQSVREDVSTEFVGDEKASLSVAKQTSATLNTGVNSNLSGNLGVTIPVKKIPIKAGAEAGAKANASSTISHSVTQTRERISQTTFKAASRFQKSLSSTVETSEEAGLEATVTETITNPNPCHTLNYHFFEVTERWQVSTRVASVDAHLLLPLPMPVFTKSFLLCHECLLRKHITCDAHHQGFEAARRLLINEHLGEFQGSLAGEEFDAFADQLLEELGKLLSIYQTLATAGLGIGGAVESDGSNHFSNAWDAAEEEWNNFWEDPLGYMTDKGNEVVGAISDGAEKVVGSTKDAIGATADFVGGFLGQARMQAPVPMGAPGFFQAQQSDPAGIGSYIYWQVVRIAAPEIDSALAGLAAAYNHVRSMPAGPARTRALFEAQKAFFIAIGDVDAAFRKVDQALCYLIAGTALAGMVGVGLVAALMAPFAAAAGGGVMVLATLASALGAGVVTALTALGTSIAAVLADHTGAVDIAPDDRGLKSAIQGLYGLFQQFGHAINLPAPPREGSSPELVAAYYRELEERKREQRDLANDAVELDRLVCYLERNHLYFAQVLATQMGTDRVQALLERYQIPPQAVEPRISGFVGTRAAFRALDLQWLSLSGVDFEATIADLHKAKPVTDNMRPIEIVLPTRGLVVEPALGECDACDDDIKKHLRLPANRPDP